jgi:hypothetical protein
MPRCDRIGGISAKNLALSCDYRTFIEEFQAFFRKKPEKPGNVSIFFKNYRSVS